MKERSDVVIDLGSYTQTLHDGQCVGQRSREVECNRAVEGVGGERDEELLNAL